MANKTVSKKEKQSKFKGSRYFTSGICARLSIHSSSQTNRIQRNNAYSVKKNIYFWKTMINTAAKSILVQCYYMTREISSTFSRINCQTSIPSEKCFKLAQSRAARVGKRKYNLNGISTTPRRCFQ